MAVLITQYAYSEYFSYFWINEKSALFHPFIFDNLLPQVFIVYFTLDYVLLQIIKESEINFVME